ncbi:hypothetical protein V500_01651 [Pseudogymnoascus sp. VKM F-4518 (FW-2643)]|nr:hypothetical protein V500_01651 [Pseudogymnoascus sp. VKM F-4518 (FW-2643)]
MALTGNLLASDESSPDLPPSIEFRIKIASGPGATVTGWPSKGGIYALSSCLGVELDFLELDRFRNKERPSASDADSNSDEEAHCNRMRQLGATWWRSEEAYHLSRLEYPAPSNSFLKVGWPAGGGVWVLKTTLEGAGEKGAGMIQNAYSMEERCRVIKQIGGIFYANAKKCPDLDLP